MEYATDGITLTITGATEPEAMECLGAAGQTELASINALNFARRSRSHMFAIDKFAMEPGPKVIYIPASDSFNLVIS